MKSITALKLKLKSGGANLVMVKNTLAKIAVKQVFNDENIAKCFKGYPIGMIYGDIGFCAKEVKQFVKNNQDMLAVIGGLADRQLFSEKEFDFFTSLPSKEELQNKLRQIIASPVTSLTRVLASPAITLKKIKTALSTIEEA